MLNYLRAYSLCLLLDRFACPEISGQGNKYKSRVKRYELKLGCMTWISFKLLLLLGFLLFLNMHKSNTYMICILYDIYHLL